MSIAFEKRDYFIPNFDENDSDEDGEFTNAAGSSEKIEHTLFKDGEDFLLYRSSEILNVFRKMTYDDAVEIFDNCTPQKLADFISSYKKKI